MTPHYNYLYVSPELKQRRLDESIRLTTAFYSKQPYIPTNILRSKWSKFFVSGVNYIYLRVFILWIANTPYIMYSCFSVTNDRLCEINLEILEEALNHRAIISSNE